MRTNLGPRGYGPKCGRRWVSANDKKWSCGTSNSAKVDNYANQTVMTPAPPIETETWEGIEKERERELRVVREEKRGWYESWKVEGALHDDMFWFLMYRSGFYGLMGYRNRLVPHSLPSKSVCSGRNPTRRLASSPCLSWMKRWHSHTQLVTLQQVNWTLIDWLKPFNRVFICWASHMLGISDAFIWKGLPLQEKLLSPHSFILPLGSHLRYLTPP
jgi:hypothetical protein